MRIARQESPGTVHHVISRFVDHSWLLTEDVERDRYLHFLGKSLRRSDWRCLAYALMSNHLHFAMVAGQDTLESWTKRVHSPFANWMNARRSRLGPMFADRPSTFAIRPDAERHLIAYIHNNPVRAGVVTRARDSGWTSHPMYVRARLVPDWLHVDEGLERCGVEAADFDTWVAGDTQRAEDPNIEGVSRAARKRGALHVATPTMGPVAIPLVARHFARIRPDPRDVVRVVAEVAGVSAAEFASRKTEREYVDARYVAVQAGKALGLTGSEVAAALGVGRQTASRLAARECDTALRAIVDVVVRRFEGRRAIDGNNTRR